MNISKSKLEVANEISMKQDAIAFWLSLREKLEETRQNYSEENIERDTSNKNLKWRDCM